MPFSLTILIEYVCSFKHDGGRYNEGPGPAGMTNGASVKAPGELIMAAEERRSAGAYREAAALWREILRQYPHHMDRPSWAYAYAEVLRLAGGEDRAAAIFATLQRICPDRMEGFAGLALLHQRAGAYDHADRLWRILLERWPAHPDRWWWLASAAFALIELDDLEGADGLCHQAVTEFSGRPGGHAAHSLLAERQFKWKDALSRIDQALALSPEAERPQLIASKARILRDMGATTASAELLSKELSSRPDSVHLAVAAAELAEATGPTAAALQCWDRCMTAWPHEASGVIGKARLHRRIGETGKSLSLLEQARQRWPESAAIHQEIAEALAQDRQVDEARAAWRQALQHARSSLPLFMGYCRFLGSLGDQAGLERALSGRAPPPGVETRCRLEYEKAARNLDAALLCLAAIRRRSPSSARDAFSEAELRSWRQEEGDLEQAELILRGLTGENLAGAGAAALLVRVLVLLGEADAATAVIQDLPYGGGHAAFAEALIWREVHRKDVAAAKRKWADHADRFFSPAIHLPKADLRLVRSLPPVAGGGLQLVSVIRNELPRLPAFFAHYRAMGVERFLIVDNVSNDGSAAYMEGQPDVTLYATEESYAASVYGVRWLNQLIDMHAGGGWIIHADADERLVHAEGEGRTLTEIADHLTRMGHEIVPAVMIDMFQHPVEAPAPGAMWFDPPRVRPSTRSPYIEVSGGARKRLFGVTVTLSKAPMIRPSAGIRYLSAHETTPGRVSDMRMALLHHHLDYLLGAEGRQRVKEEVERGQHSDLAVERRRMLRQMENASPADMRGPGSVRYTGPAQLLELGLISAPGEG